MGMSKQPGHSDSTPSVFFRMILEPVLLRLLQLRLGHLSSKPSRRTVDGLHPEELLVVRFGESLCTMNRKLEDSFIEWSDQHAALELRGC